VIVGYQARGTLGRQLVDGKAYVKLWGEEIRVGAKIHTVGGLSAHADQAGLLGWYGGFEGRPPVYLVHGEEDAQQVLAAKIRDRYGADVIRATQGQAVDLSKAGKKA